MFDNFSMYAGSMLDALPTVSILVIQGGSDGCIDGFEVNALEVDGQGVVVLRDLTTVLVPFSTLSGAGGVPDVGRSRLSRATGQPDPSYGTLEPLGGQPVPWKGKVSPK